MRVIQLINDMSVIGGPALGVPELCNALAALGVDVALYTLARGKVDTTAFRFAYQEFPSARILRNLAISSPLHHALQFAAREPVILHSHMMWSMPSIYPSWVKRDTRARTVNSPRGSLAPWAFGWRRWRKAPFWWLLQKRALETCTCLHATSEAEFLDVRDRGLTAPVAIIPNPIPLPASAERAPLDCSRRRRLLYLGRLHPIKRLDSLLRSWRQVEPEFPDWELHLVGPEHPGYRIELKRLAADLGCNRITFLDEVRGTAKADAFRHADLFVLTSHSENFGIVVGEALSYGVPAIVCKGAPWAGLETHDCGWWIDPDDEALTAALREALAHDDAQLRAKGARGRAWVENEFSSHRVGNMMRETYSWLLGDCDRPAWIRE